jgi:hypothetical protein
MTDSGEPKQDDVWDELNAQVRPDTEPDPRQIHDFVLHLQERQIHPVLIFGTALSGKTLMILSLLQYAKQKAGAGIHVRLGESVFPPQYPFAEDRNRDAEHLFNILTTDFASGDLVPSTQKLVPFFVPIDVEFGGVTHKFALLEGNGEWYERDEYSFKQFKREISGILSGYAGPISTIFVAPSKEERSTKTRSFAHECVAYCIEQYEKNRLVRDRDNLLLLVTKWDTLRNPGRPNERFSDTTPSELLAEIEPWRNIWQKFSSLSGPARAVTPYSAGWINNDKMIVRDKRFDRVFDKFNRTLWNWIYGNLVEAASVARPLARATLYEDVKLPTPTAAPFYRRLVRTCLWV